MANIRIDFNDKDLQKRLNDLTKRFVKRKKKAILRKGAVIVAKQLKTDTPEDTGNLSKTVKPKTWSRSEDYFAGHIKNAATDPYFAAFLNEGWTHRWDPRPIGAKKKEEPAAFERYIGKHKNFIQKATQKAAPQVIEKIKQEVIKEIQRP